MTTSESLLRLQLTDSDIELLRYRIPRLPEVVAAQATASAVSEWEQQSRALQAQIDAFEAAIRSSEEANETIGKQRARLEQQLKTVIAPREAEALMHEIDLLNGRRSALDDIELDALERLAAVEAELSEHRGIEAELRAAADAAESTAATAKAAGEAELADKLGARDAMRAALDGATLSRYDTMRAQHNGVAIAKLNGLRCEGCHLDLSRGEVDEIKRMPDDELAECPNCGRLLVR